MRTSHEMMLVCEHVAIAALSITQDAIRFAIDWLLTRVSPRSKYCHACRTCRHSAPCFAGLRQDKALAGTRYRKYCPVRTTSNASSIASSSAANFRHRFEAWSRVPLRDFGVVDCIPRTRPHCLDNAFARRRLLRNLPAHRFCTPCLLMIQLGLNASIR